MGHLTLFAAAALTLPLCLALRSDVAWAPWALVVMTGLTATRMTPNFPPDSYIGRPDDHTLRPRAEPARSANNRNLS